MELKKKPLLNIIVYLLLYLLGGTVLTYLIAYIVSAASNLDLTSIIEQMSENHYDDINLFTKANFSAALANFIVYLLMFISLVGINFKELKEHFFKIKTTWKSFIIYALFGFIILYGVSFIIDYLYDLYNIGISENQNTIENYINYGNATLTFLAVVLLAPLVEEIIYRYSIFSLIQNKVLAYIISTLFFALPHMLSTSGPALEWMLLAIPYLFSGLMLDLIFDSSKNIYASTMAHLLNNLVAFILIVI